MSYKVTCSVMRDYALNTRNAKNNGTRNCTDQVNIPNCIKPQGNMRDYAANTRSVKHDTFKLHLAASIHNKKCIHNIPAHILAMSPPLQSVQYFQCKQWKMQPRRHHSKSAPHKTKWKCKRANWKGKGKGKM